MYRVDPYDGLHSSSTSFFPESLYSEMTDASSFESVTMDRDFIKPFPLHTSAASDSDDSSIGMAESMSFSNTADLCDDLRFILGMPDMCDVKFLVGKDKVPIHAVKAILATRSREFYKMILDSHRNINKSDETPKKSNRFLSKLRKLRRKNAPPASKSVASSSGHMIFEIDQFDVESFRKLVGYLHSGSINVTIDTVIGIMNAADSYGLEDLRVACFRFAEKFINTHTVLQLLSATEQYIAFKWTKHIKTEILEYISEKAQDVLKHPDFENLSKQAAILIFLRPELKATEEVKWDAAYRWSRRYCSKREINLFRSTIKIFTPRINFMNISLNKLTREIKPLSILPEELITRAIAHQRSPRFVIGQERTPCAPQKPPRKSGVRRSLPMHATPNDAHVQRKSSSASYGSTDSGFASSLDNYSML